MTERELIVLADCAYAAATRSDSKLLAYYDEPDKQRGDTLAFFIMSELQATYAPEFHKDDASQRQEARRILQNAVEELQAVIAAL